MPKSTPGHPGGSQNRDPGDPKFIKFVDKDQNVIPGLSWEGPGRALEATGADFGRQLGPAGASGSDMLRPRGIGDVKFSHFSHTIVFIKF